MNVLYGMDSAIVPDRHSGAAERVDSSSALVAKVIWPPGQAESCEAGGPGPKMENHLKVCFSCCPGRRGLTSQLGNLAISNGLKSHLGLDKPMHLKSQWLKFLVNAGCDLRPL